MQLIFLMFLSSLVLAQCTHTVSPAPKEIMRHDPENPYLKCLRSYVQIHKKIDPEGYVSCQSLLQPDSHGDLYSQAIYSVIKLNSDQLDPCYDKALEGKPDLRGRLKVSWQINATGHTQDVKMVETTIADKALQSCVEESIQNWIFPIPSFHPIQVSSPFTFSPN